LTGCDTAAAPRLAVIKFEFGNEGEGTIDEVLIPYFRMITENSGTIRSVYVDPDGSSVNTPSFQVTKLNGRVIYTAFAVSGPTERIDIGNDSNLISFTPDSSGILTTLPICFPNSVPFYQPTDLMPGKTYTLRIMLRLDEIHVADGIEFLDARNLVAFIEE
jgi:hypothetical protein